MDLSCACSQSCDLRTLVLDVKDRPAGPSVLARVRPRHHRHLDALSLHAARCSSVGHTPSRRASHEHRDAGHRGLRRAFVGRACSPRLALITATRSRRCECASRTHPGRWSVAGILVRGRAGRVQVIVRGRRLLACRARCSCSWHVVLPALRWLPCSRSPSSTGSRSRLVVEADNRARTCTRMAYSLTPTRAPILADAGVRQPGPLRRLHLLRCRSSPLGRRAAL